MKITCHFYTRLKPFALSFKSLTCEEDEESQILHERGL